MNGLDLARESKSPATPSQSLMLLTYAATLLLSAGLVFVIQPMFAKIALPLLGGSPQVWNTAMLCFQALLLLGYGYAHLSATYLKPGWQALLHLVVVALAFAMLPVEAVTWTPPSESMQVIWLIGFLLASIGLPFFVTSATAPLLQRWFATTDHPAAADPYFLYSASNIGSMGALLGFPLLLERELTVRGQEWAWSIGYMVLTVLVVGCAVFRSRRQLQPFAAELPAPAAERRISWGQRGMWTLLAFVPSSLLLGVTTYITTHIAAAPLFWIIPLTLYLLTFILVFARRPLFRQRPLVWSSRSR